LALRIGWFYTAPKIFKKLKVFLAAESHGAHGEVENMVMRNQCSTWLLGGTYDLNSRNEESYRQLLDTFKNQEHELNTNSCFALIAK
jgi:hypothetical protein